MLFVAAVRRLRRSTALRARPQAAGAARGRDGAGRGAAARAAGLRVWLLLSAMGSFMLLAVTNHITHDVASVPFLWILPLTLYLLSFILCFEGRGWYRRRIFLGPLLVIVGAMAWALYTERGIVDIKEAVPLFCAGLFVMCMFFHGELAALKPAPRYLTRFYLMVSLGGALGGLAGGARRAQALQHLLRVQRRPGRDAADRRLRDARDARARADARAGRRRLHRLLRLQLHRAALARTPGS